MKYVTIYVGKENNTKKILGGNKMDKKLETLEKSNYRIGVDTNESN